MPKFRYSATTPEGKRQSGTITAATSVSARYELISRQLTVKSLRERKAFNKIEITKKKVKPQDIANLSRQLSAFMRAGIPILDALEATSTESSPEMRVMLQEIAAQLRAGDTFSDAIAAHAENFPTYYPGITRSAELSGQLDVVLEQLAEYIDRDQATRRKVKSALTYPLVLAGMSVVTVVVLVGFVLPKFAVFFKEFGTELPLTTRIMLGAGDVFQAYWWAIFGSVFLAFVLFMTVGRSESGRLFRNRLALRVPAVREVVRASVVERFCRILSAMVQAGIPIADAMAAAIDSTDNRVFKRSLIPASKRMLGGDGLATPLGESGLFPGMVVQMMRVGEETGTLDSQLEIAADFYEKELSFKLERLTALFEPMVIIAMGCVVGFVAVALVQAMYGIYSQPTVGG
jgi:type IV pilus assembly protein PilC